jgi:succinate dehydrogenase hydrophobic anchor subunit
MVTLRSNGSGWWLFQRVSGAALVILLLLHFAIMHFSGMTMDFDAVSARLASGLWKTVDITFLLLALGHGLYGFYIVTGDYFHQAWLRVSVFTACAMGGLVLAILGIITVVTV